MTRLALARLLCRWLAPDHAVVPRTPTPRMLNAAAAAMSPGKRPTSKWVSVKEKHRTRYRAMIEAGEMA